MLAPLSPDPRGSTNLVHLKGLSTIKIPNVEALPNTVETKHNIKKIVEKDPVCNGMDQDPILSGIF